MRLDDGELLLLIRAVEERARVLKLESERKVRSTLSLHVRDIAQARYENYQHVWEKLKREAVKRYDNGGPLVLNGSETNGQERGSRHAAAKRRR